MKYESKITGIGDMASELLNENGSLIIFNENAPEELAEISFLHTISQFKSQIEVGDVLELGDFMYTITAIGEEAFHTLKELGHCTFKFSGQDIVKLPGEIELSGDEMPRLKIGDRIVLR